MATEQRFKYPKRIGTAGISGHHYETKLLTFLLQRAYNDEKIENFLLGTNLDGIGALDDLIFSYDYDGKRKITFVQAKHRDDPKKNRITWNDIQMENGDFSLLKYFDSYLRIISKIHPASDNEFFKTELRNTDCDLIILTPAEAHFTDTPYIREIQLTQGDILRTRKNGKVFQIDCDYPDIINKLVKVASDARMKLLAASLAKFIFSKKNNYRNMMLDDMIRIYHVALTKNVITVSNPSKGDYLEGRMSPEFYSSQDNSIVALRQALYEQAVVFRENEKLPRDKFQQLVENLSKFPSAENISKLLGNELIFDAKSGKLIAKYGFSSKNNCLDNLRIEPKVIADAIEIVGKEILATTNFKLPENFNNADFKAREKRLIHLANKFVELLKNFVNKNGLKIVTIDSNTTELQAGELGLNGGIAGLVGNVLVRDEETELLKFNYKDRIFGETAQKFLQTLETLIEEKADCAPLRIFRFHINIPIFPVLSLKCGHDTIKDFLSKLKFYTNQSKEDEVEKITKNEMKYVSNCDKNLPYRLAVDAIYLKIHDEIQKWWKQSGDSHFLTKTWNVFVDIPNLIIQSPLLSVLNFSYLDKIKQTHVRFKEECVQVLKLDNFTNNPTEQCLNIITKRNELTALKLLQHFGDENSDTFFIDLDYLFARGCFSKAIDEFCDKGILLVVDCKSKVNLNELLDELDVVLQNFPKKKVILLTISSLTERSENSIFNNCPKIKDLRNGFFDLDSNSQTKLLKCQVMYQGKNVNLSAIDDDVKVSISDTLLFSLMKNETVILDPCTLLSHTAPLLANFDEKSKKYMELLVTILEEESKLTFGFPARERCEELLKIVGKTLDRIASLTNHSPKYFNELNDDLNEFFLKLKEIFSSATRETHEDDNEKIFRDVVQEFLVKLVNKLTVNVFKKTETLVKELNNDSQPTVHKINQFGKKVMHRLPPNIGHEVETVVREIGEKIEPTLNNVQHLAELSANFVKQIETTVQKIDNNQLSSNFNTVENLAVNIVHEANEIYNVVGPSLVSAVPQIQNAFKSIFRR